MAGRPLEIWFEDEARVGQQGTYDAVWNEIGSRPAVARDDRHDSAWLFGSVCPQRAVGSALVLPWVSSEAMSLHLDALGKVVSPGASRRARVRPPRLAPNRSRLRVPDNIALPPLPSHSPQLNPIENVWATRAETSSTSACGTAPTRSSRPAARRGTLSSTTSNGSNQ